MGSISYPWTFCKNLSTLIVSCALLIRVLSIGYVIGGIGILSKTPLLRCTSTLNDCKLGIFPLGTFFISLILALTPAVIVNVTNSSITYLGICMRRNHYLQISTVLSILNLIWFIILIGLWSWQINEVKVLECCGVDRTTTPPGSTPSPTDCRLCFDVFLNMMHTYGRFYIAALILNCITEIIMIVGTSYLHGFYAILLKSPSVKTFDSKELHKLRNGAIVSMCLSLKENWKRNKLSSFFGYMSVFSLVIDGTIILAIFFSRIYYQDVTLTEGFNQISGPNNMNMGSIKDGLLVATVCDMVWSILAKALSLGGVRLMKRWLFVLLYCCFEKDSSECSEYTYPTTTVSMISYQSVCDSWNNGALFLWTSTGILIFHIILKVVVFVLSVKILRRFSRTRVGIDEENKSISKETNPQPSFEAEHSKLLTTRMEKNIGSKSIDKTENIALKSEKNVSSNIRTKEKLNRQQLKSNSEKKKKTNKRQHELTSEKKKMKKKRKKRIFPRE